MDDKFSLKEIRLNNQGYDRRGQYYGVGPKVFVAESARTGECIEFRSSNREQAKLKLARALQHVGLGMDKDFNVYAIQRFKGR